MNGTLLLDNWTAEETAPLAPHKSALEPSEPRKISGNLAKPKPAISQIAHWLDHGDTDPADPEKLARMEVLFVD